MKPRTLQDMLLRIKQLEFSIIAAQEMCALLRASFEERDGLPAEQVIITDDGRAVPQTAIVGVLELLDKYIHTCSAELAELHSTAVPGDKK